MEAAAANRDSLRSQICRIRETIERALNADTTLSERLRTLFREQGVTIASLLAAFGFIMSTIVVTIQTGSGGVTPAPALAERLWAAVLALVAAAAVYYHQRQ